MSVKEEANEMAFVREDIPLEKRKFVNKYLPNMKFSKYDYWDVDYEREAYWIWGGGNTYEHLDYYVLIWKGKKTFVNTYGWLERLGDKTQCFKNIISFHAAASLKDDKDELVQIVKEVMQCGYDNELVINKMAEPEFLEQIK